MKQCIIIMIVGVFFSISIQAQKVAMFETTFYFEDAVGNMDSIRVGHDTAANYSYNPEFGESFINTPFDSVFEVRASHRENFPGISPNTKPEDFFLSKKIIGYSEVGPHPVHGCISGDPIIFTIYAKYPPVTVTWDSMEFIQSYCLVGSYLSDNFLSETLNEWWTFPELVEEYTCLADTGNKLIEFEGKWDFPYTLFPYPVSGSNGIDTIHSVMYTPMSFYQFTPCQSWWVGTKNPEIHFINLWCPNPVQGDLRRIDQNSGDWQVVSLLGQVILEGHGSTISMAGLPTGSYVVVTLLENGIGIQKIQKVE
ncbi:MAG: T9SS type A sorting domain-containing protein [Saprospiraceae bacterium]|nr:T9SS type A sorting domain-containing protein [Saprospiraceae bacterium]